MVKLKGPGLAANASGTIGGSVTFSSNKGHQYLKLHRKPKQPRTENQLAMRHMMTWLAAQWINFTDEQKATWQELANAGNIALSHAFNGENLRRWRSLLAPSIVYPATEAGTDNIMGNWQTQCHGHFVRIRYLPGAINDGWGVAFFATPKPTGPDSWSQLVNVQALTAFTWAEFDYYPEESGTYRVGNNQFTFDGKWKSPNIVHVGPPCVITV